MKFFSRDNKNKKYQGERDHVDFHYVRIERKSLTELNDKLEKLSLERDAARKLAKQAINLLQRMPCSKQMPCSLVDLRFEEELPDWVFDD